MPWKSIKLNDGDKKLPEIGFGSWLIGSGQTVVDQIEQAIETGFSHIDTAQIYKNESEVGKGISESGLARDDIWVTSKWSGMDGKGITQSLNESLDYLGLKSLDLYLIHSPRLTKGDHVGAWNEMLQVQKDGLTKVVGVSNFEIADLEVLRKAKLKTPAVNQILLHPYVFTKQAPLLAYHATQGIVTEAYSSLFPLTHETDGPLAAPLAEIANEHRVGEAAVLFAWARSKGAVIITTSRQKYRLEEYLAAGDLHLSEAEILRIDLAGAKFESWKRMQRVKKGLMGVALAGLAVVGWYRRF